MLSPSFVPFPVIQTERLVLRATTLADAPQLFYLRSSPIVMQYIDRPRPSAVADIETLINTIQQRIASGEGIEWGITLLGDDTYIGSISFHRIEPDKDLAEVGYLLHPDHHGKGIMHEAITAVLQFGFHSLGLKVVAAEIHADNIASKALVVKSGFVLQKKLDDGYLKYLLVS